MGGKLIFENEDDIFYDDATKILKSPPEGWNNYTGQVWEDTK